MGFWIFMLIMDLLIPIVMIGFGSYFTKRAPREINHTFGYRTTMSMKNRDTWEFAHHYCGKLWFILGWVMFAVSIVAMLFAAKKDINYVGIYGGILCGVQIAVLIASVFPTENALNKSFDEFGHRRK